MQKTACIFEMQAVFMVRFFYIILISVPLVLPFIQHNMLAHRLTPTDIFTPPCAHNVDDRIGGASVFRDRILHLGRHLLVYGPLDDPIPLKLAQLLDQDLFRHAGDAAAQLPRALRSRHEQANDQRFPFAAENFQRGFYS